MIGRRRDEGKRAARGTAGKRRSHREERARETVREPPRKEPGTRKRSAGPPLKVGTAKKAKSTMTPQEVVRNTRGGKRRCSERAMH